MASVTLPLGSLSVGAAWLSITPHIKAYQKSNVWEQRIAEQSLKKRPGPTYAPSKKVLDVQRNPVAPLESKGTFRQSLHSSLVFS